MSGQRTAIITGASRGLGLAVARELANRGWRLVIDARGAAELEAVAQDLGELTEVQAIPGDVADDFHAGALVGAAGERVDLLINNASILGPGGQPGLSDYPLSELASVFRINVLGPLGLIQMALRRMHGGVVINVTSDAAVEAYGGWGGYGSSKAALEQLTAVLAVERPDLRIYAVDPGDMRTRMHQEAYRGQDISDRPPPEQSVPGLLALIDGGLPSGRYQARELAGAPA